MNLSWANLRTCMSITKLTAMKNLLWFCRTSDSSSLSRITDSLIPLLKKEYNVTLLSNKTKLEGIKHVEIGTDSSSIYYRDFIRAMPNVNENTIRSINMKYVLVQIVDLIHSGDYDCLLICNGIYEIDWFTKILSGNNKYLINENGKKTQLIIWAPIDYIPSIDVIRNSLNADKFLTMTPIMREEIEKLSIGTAHNCKFYDVGHGSDIGYGSGIEGVLPIHKIVTELNRLIDTRVIFARKSIHAENDYIILNANNYGPLEKGTTSVINTPGTRKRLDITIKAFIQLLKENECKCGYDHDEYLCDCEQEREDYNKCGLRMIRNKNLKLWIHTNLKSFFEMLSIEGISLEPIMNNIILSENTLTTDQLAMIYRVCRVSLQTSTGEGWSLTNLESAVYRSLQVVPDFLACGYHFKNRGVLIPVTRKVIKNEGGMDVTIGEVSVEDTVDALRKTFHIVGNCDCECDCENKGGEIIDLAYNYATDHTWNKVAKRLIDVMND